MYQEAEARELAEKFQWTVKADGQYFRRVVPSPQPIGIVECDAIETLIKRNHLVICTGGGGIPVKRENNKLVGVEAVIDKDMSAAYLAKQLNADALLILTDADAVYLDWGKATQKAITSITPRALAHYHFDAGSMGLQN